MCLLFHRFLLFASMFVVTSLSRAQGSSPLPPSVMDKPDTVLFESDGSGKSKGLKFQIKIPDNYKPRDLEGEHIVKAFLRSERSSAIYVIVYRHGTKLTPDLTNKLHSLANMTNAVAANSKENKIIAHKDSLDINGLRASYIETIVTIDNIRSYTRLYYVALDDYLVGLSFAIIDDERKSEREMMKKFDAARNFFDRTARTFKVIR